MKYGVIFTPEEVSRSREQSAMQASLGLNIDQEARPTKLGAENIKIFNLILGTVLVMFISTFPQGTSGAVRQKTRMF